MSKGKKILIFGVTGQDGSLIAKYLLQKNLKFTVWLENQPQVI